MNIIVADNSLVSYMGHSFEYARSIQEHARALGHTTQVLASQMVSSQVVDAIGAIPCFRFGLDHGFPVPGISLLPSTWAQVVFGEWNYRRHNETLYADLRTAEPSLQLDSDSVALFHTIRHNQILPIVRWAERLPEKSRPRFALVLHFTAYPDYSFPSHTAHFYRRAFRYLERSPVRDRFRLFADSTALIREYRTHTRIPVSLVPLPHGAGSGSAVIGNEGAVAGGPVCLTYAGDARVNKGFHLLPYVFERLKPLMDRGEVDAELQANVRVESEWQVKLAVESLRRLGVRLCETELPSREYDALLNRAGIVLVPYTLDYYHTQTSGILGEALARGKPVVAPRGTWMAEQLSRHGAGVTFLPSDRQSLYEAVTEAIRTYPALRDRARKAAPAWAREHCASAFLDRILDAFAEPAEL